MKIYQKLKYPCGYESEMLFSSITFIGIIKITEAKPCPLHGTKCSIKI